MGRSARPMSKRQKTALTALGIAGCVVFYASAIVTEWLMLLMFPIAYVTVVVRNW